MSVEGTVGTDQQGAPGAGQQQLWGIINDLKSTQRGLMAGDSRCHGYGQQLGNTIDRLQEFAGTAGTTGQQEHLVTAGGGPMRAETSPPNTAQAGRVT